MNMIAVAPFIWLLLSTLSLPPAIAFGQVNRITYVQSTFDTDFDGWTSNTPEETAWSETALHSSGWNRGSERSLLDSSLQVIGNVGT